MVQWLVTAVTDLKEFQHFEQWALIRERNVFPDKRLLLEMMEFFEINHGSYQPFNFFTLFDTICAVFYFYINTSNYDNNIAYYW